MTQRNLAVELRPRRLSEMVGQDALVQDVRNMFSGGNIPISILITGEYGSGKTTLAYILALSFNCTHQKQFGEPCDYCLENTEAFSIIERNCALMSTKDEMQEFLPTIRSYPQFGKYRIVILDEMQQLSAAAQQTLLKEFERKDSINIFIICTTNPEKINQGLKDRSTVFPIPMLTKDCIARTVHNTIAQCKMPPRDPDPLIKCLQDAFVFSSRLVVKATEAYLSGMTAERAIVSIRDAGEIDFLALYKAVSWGKWDEVRTQMEKAKPVDATPIKMRLSAFFRSDLLRAKTSNRAALLASFIEALGSASAVETGLELSMVCSVLYKICQIVNENKKPIVIRKVA
jgi:hypothetical protein